MPKGSFITSVNNVSAKLKIIEEAATLFDTKSIAILEQLSGLSLIEAMADLRKGNYLGNRKVDINLSLNMIGITESTPEADALAIWTDSTKTVLYDKATITFVDGAVVVINFVFDAVAVTISTHADLLIQFNQDANFLAKLNGTSMSGFATPVVGEIVRFYDVIGSNSNIERIVLNAVGGSYIEQSPTYFWGKTTSAFQTLSMRSGDIIKIGNEVDNLILLANSITQLLALRDRVPELVDTFDVNGVANGDVTVYNKLTELNKIYIEIQKLITIYDDIKIGGTNYTKTVADNLNNATSTINTVAIDLQLGVNSLSKIVAENMNDVNILSGSINSVNTLVNNLVNIDLTALNIPSVKDVSTNMTSVKNAVINAQTATDQAVIAATKAAEIKGITIDSVITAVAGSGANVTYNPATGAFSFTIPQGIKGDKGDAFLVNAVGLAVDRALYDSSVKGFSFLALDASLIYFKLSGTSGDWSSGAPFGKGDKGDIGIGIVNIVFTSTTDVGGIAGASGATDTYTITYTDISTTTFLVYNGKDSALLSVAGRTGNVVLVKADVGLANVENTADIDKKVSTATQAEINAKANFSDMTSDGVVAGLSIPTNVTLTSTIASGIAYINGNRHITIATAKTFTASVDTYVDIDSSGSFVYSEVPLGNAQPALVSPNQRLAKITTDATTVASVVDMRVMITVNLATKEDKFVSKTISTATTAVDKDFLKVDTLTVGAVPVTMPVGVESKIVKFTDIKSNFDVNNLTIIPATGDVIMGTAVDEPMVVSKKNATFSLQFLDNNWRIV